MTANKLKNFFLPGVIACTLLLASCAPEDTTTPTPTDARDKIIGTYSCEENENASSVTTFDITIKKSTTASDGLLIDNFYNIGNQYSTSATLQNTTLSIKQQNVSSFGIVGDGSFNGSNKITFTYKATAGGTNNNCTAVATKQ
jgi:hypothetical protein